MFAIKRIGRENPQQPLTMVPFCDAGLPRPQPHVFTCVSDTEKLVFSAIDVGSCSSGGKYCTNGPSVHGHSNALDDDNADDNTEDGEEEEEVVKRVGGL